MSDARKYNICKTCYRGALKPMFGVDRTAIIGDKICIVPNGMPIITCTYCGEMNIDDDEAKYLLSP